MTEQEQKKVFSKNLNRLLAVAGLSQKDVADAIGVSPQRFNTWCQGSALPRLGAVQRLADYFGVGKDELIDEAPQKASTRISVLGRVRAGIPNEAIEDIIDFEDIPAHMAATGEFMGLRIVGDSMEPDIHDGDTVIVKLQSDADSGDIVIALINGNDGACKKLTKHKDGITLSSVNPAYAPMFFSNKEVQSLPVSIFGKVVELRRHFG